MQASRDKANLTKEQKSKMACFQFVYKGTCSKDRDCEYSHARPVLKAYMEDQAKRFTNSPFVTSKHREIASRTPSASLMKAPDQRYEAMDSRKKLFEKTQVGRRPFSKGKQLKSLESEIQDPVEAQDEVFDPYERSQDYGANY